MLVVSVHVISVQDFTLLHKRLGHPSDKVLHEVLKQCNKTFVNKARVFYDPC